MALKKVYGVIFIDIVTRFVVIELLQDRSTESFLLALMHMTASYGSVSIILSDNAAEYTAADKEIQAIMDIINSEDTRKKGRRKGH